jgi:hypothetical protein
MRRCSSLLPIQNLTKDKKKKKNKGKNNSENQKAKPLLKYPEPAIRYAIGSHFEFPEREPNERRTKVKFLEVNFKRAPFAASFFFISRQYY